MLSIGGEGANFVSQGIQKLKHYIQKDTQTDVTENSTTPLNYQLTLTNCI